MHGVIPVARTVFVLWLTSVEFTMEQRPFGLRCSLCTLAWRRLCERRESGESGCSISHLAASCHEFMYSFGEASGRHDCV